MRIILYICLDDEIFWVNRDSHEVVKFSTAGRVLLRIGTREIPSLHGPFNHPADIVNLGSHQLQNRASDTDGLVHRLAEPYGAEPL